MFPGRDPNFIVGVSVVSGSPAHPEQLRPAQPTRYAGFLHRLKQLQRSITEVPHPHFRPPLISTTDRALAVLIRSGQGRAWPRAR